MRIAKVSTCLLLFLALIGAQPANSQLQFDPPAAAFDQVQVDTVRTITINLTSGIVQDVVLSPLGAPFSVSPTTLNFTSINETKPFTVTFHPNGIGSFSQSLTATGTIWGNESVPVTGQGVAVALQAAADSLDFGVVTINQSNTVNYTVFNTGIGDLVIEGGASNDSQFLVPPGEYVVPQGQSVDVPITFTPIYSDLQSSLVSFQTNAPADHVIEVVCSGIGVSDISGDVFGVWSLGNSPYRIIGNATVPAGQELTIEPGVEVDFMFGTSLTVNGNLRALGTPDNRIDFGSRFGTGTIRSNSVNASLEFDYCDIDSLGDLGFSDGFEQFPQSAMWSGDGTVSSISPYQGSYCLNVYAQGADKEARLGPFVASGSGTFSYYWRTSRSESYCYFRVQYRRNNGNWSELYSYSSTTGWNSRSHSISASPGDVIEFRFLADTDNRSSSYDEEEFFIDNVSYVMSGDKRVIDMSGGSLVMSNSTLTSAAGHGLWVNSADRIEIVGSAFSKCVDYPIRLQSVDTEISIRQSIIRHNNRGIYISASCPVSIDQSTIRNNEEYGLTLTGGPFATISNSIFWYNKQGSQYTQIYNANAFLEITYSDIQGLDSYGITGGNVTRGPNSTGLNPQFLDLEGRLSEFSPCVDSATPWLHDTHMPPGLGTIVADMGAFGGPGNHAWGGDPVPDGTPEIRNIVDIPQDNGGFVGIQYDASLFDGQHPAYEVTHYSFWRAMELGTKGSGPTEKAAVSYYPTTPYFQTSSQQYWEHMGDMQAQQFANYAYTAPTYADSVAGNPFDIDFLVIAHTPDNDIFFTSPPASGHSADNLAPPAPEELFAEATLDGISLLWPRSRADDVLRYRIYRSLDQNMSVGEMEPLAVTADSLYLDESVGEMVDYFYVITAEDIHGNVSRPSPVATGMAPVAVYLQYYEINVEAGIPTLSWTVNATESPQFAVIRQDGSGVREELDASLVNGDGNRFSLTDRTAVADRSYVYTVRTFTGGIWMEMFSTARVETPKLEFALRPASPNPFNPMTRFAFSTTKPGLVSVSVYDLKGRLVKTLFDHYMQPGRVELTWQGDTDAGARVGSGTYFVLLRSDEGVQKQKVMLVK